MSLQDEALNPNNIIQKDQSRKEELLSKKPRDQHITLWARMASFPYWPARYCTPSEDASLKRTDKDKDKLAVCFLGKCEKALVSSILEFSPDTMDKMILKKFQADNDYKQSFIEGIRRCVGHGYKFPDEIMDLVKDTPQFTDPDHCTVCFGTDKSGISLLCDNCDKNETHLHCLRKPLMQIPMGNWYCDECCITLNLPLGTILDDPTDANTLNPESAIDNGLDLIKPRGKGRPKGGGGINVNNSVNVKKGTKSNKIGTKTTKSFNSINDLDNSKYDDSGDRLHQHNYSRPNLHGYSGQDLSEQNVKDEEVVKEDDKCFVCGEGGKLILCDFPHCPRVYHHVCVIKTVPTTPYEEISIANSSTLSSQYGTATKDFNDAWFCPSHKCICCNALDETPCPIRSLTLPLALQPSMYMQDKIVQKSLEYCSTCPFSICNDCDKDIAGRRSTLATKKFNGIKISNCRLCASNRPILKLAKALEKALVKMLKSRLSLPFLHPFLPGVTTGDEIDFDASGGKKRDFASISSSTKIPNDLLDVMDAVRSLKYKSTDEFFNDIQQLRSKLEEAIKNQNSESKSAIEQDKSPLLLAFDTILSEAKFSIQKSLRSSEFECEETDDDHKRNVKQKGDDEDPASLASEHSVPQIENSLLRLWRSECEKNVFHGIKEKNDDSHYRVIGRSLAGWEAFVIEGIMPDTFYDGYDDCMSGVFKRERQFESEAGARMLARGWVNMYGTSSSEYINDIEAAGLMLGMTGTNSRETITLLEDSYTDENLAWSKMRRVGDDSGGSSHDELTNLADDETLVMLDRLKDLSTKALHLENKLRKSYMENMRNVLETDTQQLRLGEMSILKELKLSNENLRWRLKQKQRVLLSNNLIINNLKEALNKAEMKYESCNQELQLLKADSQKNDDEMKSND